MVGAEVSAYWHLGLPGERKEMEPSRDYASNELVIKKRRKAGWPFGGKHIIR